MEQGWLAHSRFVELYVTTITGTLHLHGNESSIVALDLFHHSHSSSPLRRTFSVSISMLTQASSAADASVDASTARDEGQRC